MARSFVAASSQFLERTISVPAVGVPLTFACWFQVTDTVTPYSLVSLDPVTAGYFRIYAYQAGIGATTFDGGTAGTAVSTGTAYAANAWAHGAGVFSAVNSRTAYANGANAGSDSVSVGVGACTRLDIGRILGVQYMNGQIAEVGIWNIALTAADIAVLALGVSPLFVRPDALKFYAPLMGAYAPEIDLIGHYDLSNSGTNPSTHPRIFLSDQPFFPSKWPVVYGAAGKTLARFTPERAEFPLSNFMSRTTRNGHRVLEAVSGATESVIFSGVMPRVAYQGGRVSCILHWLTKTATTGTVGWDVSLERDNAANHDLDSDFWTATPVSTPLVSLTAGRTFTKNTSNYMSLGVAAIGPLISGATKLSLHARIFVTSVNTGVNDNSVFDILVNGVVVGVIINIDGTGSAPKVRIGARSRSSDSRQVKTGTTTIPLGVWVTVGGVIDFAAATITVYFNGVQDGTATSLTFGGTTYVHGTPTGADTVGGYLVSPSTVDQLDGAIGEVAIWNDALADSDFDLLARGACTPQQVKPTALKYSLTLSGINSPEQPSAGTPVGTITGSLPAVGYAAGTVLRSTIHLIPSEMENITAGDPFRLMVRSNPAGSATGNAQLLSAELKAT